MFEHTNTNMLKKLGEKREIPLYIPNKYCGMGGSKGKSLIWDIFIVE